MILAEGSTLRIAPGNGGAEGQYTMGQRYQREIEEILLKANEDAPDDGQKRPRNPQRSARRAPPSRGRGRSLRFTSGRLLGMGVAVLAVALILNVFGGAVRYAAPVGVGCAGGHRVHLVLHEASAHRREAMARPADRGCAGAEFALPHLALDHQGLTRPYGRRRPLLLPSRLSVPLHLSAQGATACEVISLTSNAPIQARRTARMSRIRCRRGRRRCCIHGTTSMRRAARLTAPRSRGVRAGCGVTSS